MSDRVLIVGANGFIGSNLLAACHKAGYRTRALCRRLPRCDTDWIPMAHTASDAQLETALAGVSCVLWAAGASTPVSTAHSPTAELERNLFPLTRLLEHVRGPHASRVVYISTGGAIYGDVDGLATESTALEPKSYYSAGKAAAEAFLSAWSHVGRHDVTILRPSNVYGPGQPYRPGFGIVPTAFNAIRTQEPVSIRGDGEAIRDYLYIDDLASLCLRVVAAEGHAGCRTFNASSAVGTSLNSLLHTIGEVTGQHVPRVSHPATSFDVDRIVPDNAVARAAFDWLPRTSLEDGIALTWESFR